MMRHRIAIFIGMIGICVGLSGCGSHEAADPPTDTKVEISTEGTLAPVEGAESDTDSLVEKTDDKQDTEAEKDETNISDEQVDEEIPSIRDSVLEVMGCRAGCAVAGNELDNPGVWKILTEHFSAVTLGNELKPDALVDYSVSKCPGTEITELNGEEFEVPKLNYKRAEKMLDKILQWNEEHPERKIEVRGHVLVWHSQTPEWFFHENYNKKDPYVDKNEMNKRLEWYIRTVLQHFTGEDSKYKDLFYGWDVVNEAISDGTGNCRTDSENPNEKLSEDRHGSNSSWWHIYQSDEFIINAFKYANKYAPADLELYYNDYNETSLMKRKGIIALLQEIKDNEGEPGVGTRISAMGMQGHYGMDSPSMTEIQNSIEEYCKVVGKVQFTEIDVSASSSYDGTDATRDEENERLRKRYNMIYFAMKGACQTEGVQVDGITFWGTADHLSWLQSRSNVGGGNKTGLPQLPLLFDENYEPKPCFWVFAKTE